ncbi:RBG1L protein, partial [Atractosteus spatula]|nr:RBG1L protein [Atractosteus spatula]
MKVKEESAKAGLLLNIKNLEGSIVKLKLKYFGHIMRRQDSLEKTLMLGEIEGKRRRGQQRFRWIDSITEIMNMNLMSYSASKQLEKATEELLEDQGENDDAKVEHPTSSKGKPATPINKVPPFTLQVQSAATDVPAGDSDSSAFPEEDSVLFNKLSYLGSMMVCVPRSEAEAQKAMASLKAEKHVPILVTLYVPNVPEGSVRIIEQASGTEIAAFPIYKVLFCARGRDGTPESDCFAFTESYRSCEDFQIHVFSCEIKEAVSRILYSFSTAFRRSSKPAPDVKDSSLPTPESDIFTFTVSLEVKEDDGKGNFSPVPKDRDKFYFKLRQGIEKKVVVTIQQITNKELGIERCFGMLLSPGQKVRNSDMHLLDMVRI